MILALKHQKRFKQYRGYYFDKGNGVAGYSYKGIELLFNKKTNIIITIRPAKKGI